MRVLRTLKVNQHPPFRISNSLKHHPLQHHLRHPTIHTRTLSTPSTINHRKVTHPLRTTILSALLLLYLGHTLSSRLKLVTGPSMLPTIPSSDALVHISLSHRRGRGIRVGDVIAAKHPFVEHEGFVKRVVGMPGDYVTVSQSTVGEEEGAGAGAGAFEVQDIFGGPGGRGRKKMLLVPEGHVFVEGDNRPASRDSRLYGPIPMALIWGKVTWMVYLEGMWFKFEKIKNGLVPSDDSDDSMD